MATEGDAHASPEFVDRIDELSQAEVDSAIAEQVIEGLGQLVVEAETGTPEGAAHRIALFGAIRVALIDSLDSSVGAARAKRVTWKEIGDGLGVKPQSAQRKWKNLN